MATEGELGSTTLNKWRAFADSTKFLFLTWALLVEEIDARSITLGERRALFAFSGKLVIRNDTTHLVWGAAIITNNCSKITHTLRTTDARENAESISSRCMTSFADNWIFAT